MSFPRDYILIFLYSLALTILFSSNTMNREISGFIDEVMVPVGMSSILSIVAIFHLWLARFLLSIGHAQGSFLLFILSYVLILILYLISWFLTERGRLFIQDWGERGGPHLGIYKTWRYCVKANVVYLIAWWICPVNHRPITNIIYNINLMRFWPFTVLFIVIVGVIPGAVFSGHYRDAFGKILRNYPYR